jgi:hypothetical protein
MPTNEYWNKKVFEMSTALDCILITKTERLWLVVTIISLSFAWIIFQYLTKDLKGVRQYISICCCDQYLPNSVYV